MIRSRDFEIRRITSARDMHDWLAVPAVVFAGDPNWIAPLNLAERHRISPRQSPFFSFGDAAFFVALQGGRPVGRISAQINRRHLAHYDDATGHFGFFDVIEDPRVAQNLVATAAYWLRERGMQRMVGPLSLTINEDAGLLVAGFDSSPAILSSHAVRWGGDLLEHAGLRKAIDLFAYRMKPTETPEAIARLANFARQSPRAAVRQFDMRRYPSEVATIFDIFNDAWSDNWGFVPVGDAEIAALVKDTRPIMRGKFGRIAEIDGVPAAMIVVLPNINDVIKDFNGKLLPFNWAKLLMHIKRDRWRTARIPLLGIRKAYRGTPIAAAVLSLLVAEILELGRQYNLDWVEFSWILETNEPMNRLAELAAGPPCKRYRLYEMPI